MTKLAALIVLFLAAPAPASGTAAATAAAPAATAAAPAATAAAPAATAAAPAATAAVPAATTVAPTTAGATGIGCTSTRNCTPSHGGAFMVTTRNSCTAGLPVRDRRTGAWYVLTAGHCVAKAAGATWRQSGLRLGIGTRWEYGATDAGLIRYTANGRTWRAGSRVMVVGRSVRSQRITSVKVARAGERVCVTAGRSGVTRCGRVVAARMSLTYASPGLAARRISNLAMVSGICLRPGDSGSPVFAGGSFAGIAVAKANTGCTMWYTRADVAFARLGVKLG